MNLVPHEFTSQDALAGYNHIAGPYRNGVQRCEACGGIISDDRNTMVEEGTPPIRGFARGPIHRIGNMTATGVDESLPFCDGRPIWPAELSR